MQTPSHVAISLFIWRKVPDWRSTLLVVFGAVLPDVTMFLFYGYQKIIGSEEPEIWQRLYFLEGWQFFFDIFNSIPVFLGLAFAASLLNNRWLFLVSASALVHVLCDFPLHNDDAHRHFLPFSHWRFESPVSYWDPEHFGLYALSFELLFSIGICTAMVIRNYALSVRVAAGSTLALFGAGIVLAIIVLARMSSTL